MRNDIQYKIKRAIDRFAEKQPQANIDSESARENLAQMITQDLLECDVGITTYNKDQLELFSNIEEGEHK